MKVVIFTEDKVGEGHYQAARAVAAALTQLSPEKINVQVVGGMRLVHPFFERSAAKIYLTMIRYWPRGWSYLYNNVRQPFSLQQKLFQVRLIRYLQEEKPDMVLCTHPACTNALAQLKAKVDHPYRLGVIFTDFGFHPFAVSPEADYFFVPDQSVKFTLIHQYQINPNRIFDYGIPVHPRFLQLIQGKNSGLKKGSVNGPLHLLVLGGALGLGPLKEIMDVFSHHPDRFKVTIICGKNKVLYRKLSRQTPQHITIYGYVTNMAELIYQADAVITKPGGLTVTEALLCKTPLFLLPPLPGQEENNRNYLQQHGLCWTVDRVDQLPELITEQLNKLNKDGEWEKQVDHHIKPDAAFCIAQKVLEQLR